MKIGIIHASSLKSKNELIFSCTQNAVRSQEYEVINFGVRKEEKDQYSYIETAISVSLLLSSKAVDFIITGCSSGQGMMLACNSLPGVICGYTPTPQDAFLFGRINDGNAVSLPLGLNFGWSGEVNLQCTLDKLFDGPFGIGYPKEDAERKRHDTELLKGMNHVTKSEWKDIFADIHPDLMKKSLGRKNVCDYIMSYGQDEVIKGLVELQMI